MLDSILGAVGGNQGAQGELGSLMGALGSNPQISQVLGGFLANDGESGGLVSKFERAGPGNVIGSWVGNDQNQPVSGEQLTQVLGSGAIGQIASKLGVDPARAAGQLSSILPALVNHLTPNGQVPAGGVGNTGELASLLGGLFNKA